MTFTILIPYPCAVSTAWAGPAIYLQLNQKGKTHWPYPCCTEFTPQPSHCPPLSPVLESQAQKTLLTDFPRWSSS